MPILVAALSGRALAAAARRADEAVIVADFFGDLDTTALGPWLPLGTDFARGVERDGVRALAATLPRGVEGVAYGAGFEREPELLRELASIAPLIGNPPEVVAAVKNPHAFARLLGEVGLPHPRIADSPSPDRKWLRKQSGGTGGTHIRPAGSTPLCDGGGWYHQEVAPGCPLSVLFVANGRSAAIIGFSQQWVAPSPETPFRYGGCVAPAAVSDAFAAELAEKCSRLVAATGLVGLNSLDMLAEDDTFTVLELNPRPGATLDVFDRVGEPGSLWRSHRAGVAGDLLPGSLPPRRLGARAAAVVYATEDLRVAEDLRSWGDWIADVPTPLSTIGTGEPICTVLAEGHDADDARAQVESRAEAVLRRLVRASQPIEVSA
jgi:predicted ATP-grasp superfamily ATP-dependent carboligase